MGKGRVGPGDLGRQGAGASGHDGATADGLRKLEPRMSGADAARGRRRWIARGAARCGNFPIRGSEGADSLRDWDPIRTRRWWHESGPAVEAAARSLKGGPRPYRRPRGATDCMKSGLPAERCWVPAPRARTMLTASAAGESIVGLRPRL